MYRYTVTKFPSLYGTPKCFRFKITAYLYMFMQAIFGASAEVRLYDEKEKKYLRTW